MLSCPPCEVPPTGVLPHQTTKAGCAAGWHRTSHERINTEPDNFDTPVKVVFRAAVEPTSSLLPGQVTTVHERLTLVLDNLDTHANGAFHTPFEPSRAHS